MNGALVVVAALTAGVALAGEAFHPCVVRGRTQPGAWGVRNGEVFAEREFVAPKDGKFSFDVEFAEKEDAWYVATLRSVRKDGKTSIVSAASPIYFRGPGFKPPEVVPFPKPLPQNIKERLLYLTPEEVDTDAWYDELKQLLKDAETGGARRAWTGRNVGESPLVFRVHV